MRNLAPAIYRQRLVIEGKVKNPISPEQIENYLSQLSTVLGMKTVMPPVTHQSTRFGWAGWIHWETSGAHFYAWDEAPAFFSVDIYTCKEFDSVAAAAFSAGYFATLDLEFEEFPTPDTATFVRREAIHDLTRLLVTMADRSDREETQFGTYLIAGDSVYADIARYVELEVFSEYFGNDSSLMAAEYDSYDAVSVHIVMIDHEKLMPAGSTRVIRSSELGLKTLTDMERCTNWNVTISEMQQFHQIEINLTTTLDQATIAVLPGYRQGVISPALFHSLYLYSLAQGVENVIGIADINFLDLCRSLGTPCQVICDLPPLPYLDSKASCPLLINVSELQSAVREGRLVPIVDILRGIRGDVSVSMPSVLLTELGINEESALVSANP